MGSFSPPTPEPEPADAGNPLADARALVNLGDSDDDLNKLSNRRDATSYSVSSSFSKTYDIVCILLKLSNCDYCA